jgi:hypothetical protein
MRFTGRLSYLDFDPRTFTKSLDAAMEVQMRQAARAWLRAIMNATLPRVRGQGPDSQGIPPVWTGTARGTLRPLGKELRVAIPIKPIVKMKGRGPDIGAAQGRFAFGKKFDRYYFRFSTALKYFEENEFGESDKKLTYKTPWNAFRVGQKAFQQHCATELGRKLPKIRDSIRYKTRIIQ